MRFTGCFNKVNYYYQGWLGEKNSEVVKGMVSSERMNAFVIFGQKKSITKRKAKSSANRPNMVKVKPPTLLLAIAIIPHHQAGVSSEMCSGASEGIG